MLPFVGEGPALGIALVLSLGAGGSKPFHSFAFWLGSLASLSCRIHCLQLHLEPFVAVSLGCGKMTFDVAAAAAKATSRK